MESAPRSLGEVLARSAARHRDRPAFLRRGPREDGAVRYGELEEASRRIAGALRRAGLRKGDRVGLVGDNRWEWLACDFACARLGLPDVPRGGESPAAEVRFVLRHSGAKLAFVDHLERAREILADRDAVPELRRVVLFDDPGGGFPAVAGVEVLSLEAFQAGPLPATAEVDEAVGRDDLLTVVYTSGTTADPKGVMLTHGNVLANLAVVPGIFHFEAEDVYLALLPLWHMFERTVEYALLERGASILYTEPRSLRRDLSSGRATILAAVPRVWESVAGAIEESIDRLRPVPRAILRASLKSSLALRPPSGSSGAKPLDRIVHRFGRALLYPRVRRAAAGRLRLGVSGGASLPSRVERFFDALGFPLLNGYGMTEAAPILSVSSPGDHRRGTIGRPVPGTEVRIVDDDGRALPPGRAGRILVRGPQVTRGYWENAEATNRAIDRAGWLDTGDLGALDADGYLTMRGRAKDTIVLLGGENVEPEAIEGALRASPLVEQAAVVGQDRKNLAVLLVPRLDRLRERLPAAALDGATATIDDPAVRALFRAEIDRLVTEGAGFRPWERPAQFAVLRHAFTPAAGTLTATMKLRRHAIAARHADLIERLP